MSCTKKWVIGYVWANARLIAMASVYHGGGSVASSLFVLKGLCGITGARGEAYFTSTDEGQSPRQYRVSFPKRPASSERASPDKKVFALAECAMFKF